MFKAGGRKRLVIGLVSLVAAVFLTGQLAYAIAKGYQTSDTGLQTGMVVSLTLDGNKDTVERATQATSNTIIGVVTTTDQSPLSVSEGKTKILVENEGSVEAYVSDINGSVKTGDQLEISQLKGILMKKSDSSQGRVLATAVNDSGSSTEYSYQDGGQTKTTKISRINVNLLQGNTTTSTNDSSSLSRLGRQITGKNVGELRLILAMFIFLLVLITEGGILYGAISGGLNAMGRNPLAKKGIRSELLRVFLLAAGILIIGLSAMYAMLWI
ncbi:MAG TPA: hypothetical protein VLG25_01525 [Patescibacteria group bacterium]|nr:hypothetical protein [Patescibacteria group bacterium]